jgi:hypothetical protein
MKSGKFRSSNKNGHDEAVKCVARKARIYAID